MRFSLRRSISKYVIDKKVTTEEAIYRNMAHEIVNQVPFDVLKNLFSFNSSKHDDSFNKTSIHYSAEIEVKTDEELNSQKGPKFKS